MEELAVFNESVTFSIQHEIDGEENRREETGTKPPKLCNGVWEVSCELRPKTSYFVRGLRE